MGEVSDVRVCVLRHRLRARVCGFVSHEWFGRLESCQASYNTARHLCPVLPEHPRITYRVPLALTAALHGPEGSGVFIFMKSAVTFGVREPVQNHDQALKFIFFK